ncbi:uncharacterized protein LACBIDRAFT_308481 [Laccaria bicolor S238N-H82]|uniref:Predicted protein n=1 Tax=Laccaria bicolor (strain S238N-H82 / ATCC MYA-4686) TaxID=486041 RepID=B0CWE6_LACBS|nr:uncharacterized protein LACBIDRAFT_308481 [Laccaria bicolor S238N-H82]EDR13496.1 predicted protein [Laccaria bicolor S238N-H82]|eukprot:XP_001875994.1 predicted protein [Laccaria bicolor S238N-H82]
MGELSFSKTDSFGKPLSPLATKTVGYLLKEKKIVLLYIPVFSIIRSSHGHVGFILLAGSPETHVRDTDCVWVQIPSPDQSDILSEAPNGNVIGASACILQSLILKGKPLLVLDKTLSVIQAEVFAAWTTFLNKCKTRNQEVDLNFMESIKKDLLNNFPDPKLNSLVELFKGLLVDTPGLVEDSQVAWKTLPGEPGGSFQHAFFLQLIRQVPILITPPHIPTGFQQNFQKGIFTFPFPLDSYSTPTELQLIT